MNPDQDPNREFQRLRWQCRRGTRELDLILMGYLENRYRQAPAEEQEAFCRLLNRPDPEIEHLLWVQGTGSPAVDARLIEVLRVMRG